MLPARRRSTGWSWGPRRERATGIDAELSAADGDLPAACRPHPLGLSLVAALVVGHVFVHALWLNRVLDAQEPARARYVALARALNAHGVGPPCTLVGAESAPVAYVAGCDQVRLGSPGNERFTPRQLEHRIATQSFAVVLRAGEQAPEYARGWTQLPRSDLPRGWRILIADAKGTP